MRLALRGGSPGTLLLVVLRFRHHSLLGDAPDALREVPAGQLDVVGATTLDPFGRAPVERLLDLAGDAGDHAAVRNLRAFEHDGIRGDHALAPDARVLEDHGVHADDGAVADRAALELRAVADGHVVAHGRR